MRILMVVGNYPPDPAIGASRTGAICDYLSNRGHEVSVITTQGPWCAAEPLSTTVDRTPWVRLPALHLVRAEKGAGGSPEAGGLTRASGTVRRTRASQSLLSHRPRLARWASELIGVPDAYGGWIPFAVKAGTRRLEHSPVDAIFASAPTFSAFIAASLLSRRSGIPWAADYRDLWSNGTYYGYGSVRRRIDSTIERRTIANASLITAVSPVLLEELGCDFGIHGELVRNGYDEVDLAPRDQREPLSSAKLNLLYVGSNLYSGRRSPQPVFRAARELGLTPDLVRFHFLGTEPGMVLPIAASEGVSALVEVHPKVSREKSIKMQARADALMLLLWNDIRERGILPGKLFEYAAVRRPVLLVGYTQGEAARLIREHRLGRVADSSTSVAVALRHWLSAKSGPDLLPDIPEIHRTGLSRSEQNARLEALLEEVVAGLRTTCF